MPILAKKNLVFRWSSFGCVYAWTTQGNIATDRLTEDADFGKQIISFWSWRVCKQAKLSHLGYRKPAHIHWKADAPKTSHCLVWILVQRHNWVIFLRKSAKRDCYSQWRSLSGHFERIFVHKNWRGGYWQHLASTGQRYVPHRHSYIRWLRSHYQPQSWCHLATTEMRFDTVGLLFVRCRKR